ncbi:MAG: SPOR domain-containing protein [Desulfatiglandaceae bacterium]
MVFEAALSTARPLHITKRNISLFSLFLAFAFAGACSEQAPQEIQETKVVVPIERPPAERHPVPSTPHVTTADEFALEIPQMAALEKEQPARPSPVQEPEEQTAAKEADDHYIVQKGDTLAKIAARSDVYGDPMKWPSLFRLNQEKLGSMRVAEAFDVKWSSLFKLKTDTADGTKVLEAFDRETLPEGLRLKFFTEEEIRKNQADLAQKNWVVNVLSSQNAEDLVPPAIVLMKSGYSIYISNAIVKERKWMRLRVGFFPTRSEAMAAGKEILSILNTDETWVTQVAHRELEEFGGY